VAYQRSEDSSLDKLSIYDLLLLRLDKQDLDRREHKFNRDCDILERVETLKAHVIHARTTRCKEERKAKNFLCGFCVAILPVAGARIQLQTMQMSALHVAESVSNESSTVAGPDLALFPPRLPA
jgi:hypothetical protein